MCADTTQFKPSQPFDLDYRTLVTTSKVGNCKKKRLSYAVFVKIIFKNTQQKETFRKNNNEHYSRISDRRRGEYK